MAYKALYNMWRPLVFEDVVEQKHVVDTLKNSVIAGRINHAYLFCGTRGTGKTSVARIFARALNCLHSENGNPCNECSMCKGILAGNVLDVIEIDAASNNSVDNIREIRNEVVYKPSQAEYKVYIIDEVHMLSTGAFNALLKTLEEPPGHVVFFLATTEPHKLPATILSRCQRFDFHRISIKNIIKRINDIASACEITIEDNAARLIARLSDGALRDAISILDQCISLGKDNINYEDVLDIAGIVNDDFISDIIDAVSEKELKDLLCLVEKLTLTGKDITQFVLGLIKYCRNILMCKVLKNPDEIIEASEESLETIKRQSMNFSQNELMQIIRELSNLESALKWTTQPRTLLEVGLIKICDYDFNMNNESIISRISVLEDKISRMESGTYEKKQGNISISDNNKDKTEFIPDVEKKVKLNKKQQKKQQKKKEDSAKATENQITGDWNKIINELKTRGRMMLYTSLLNTNALKLNREQIGIVFKKSDSFNMQVVSKPENIELIESIISEKTEEKLKVKCLNEEERSYSSKQKLKESDSINKAKDIAQKLNVPLNIIDE